MGTDGSRREHIMHAWRILSPHSRPVSYTLPMELGMRETSQPSGGCPAVFTRFILRHSSASDEAAVPQSHLSDEALFTQVQAGRRDAFAALVERYQRRAFGVALRILGARHDAEDAVQQAFLRAARN